MELPTWIQLASKLTTQAGFKDQVLTTENFLDYADRLRDIILAFPEKKREAPQCKEFSLKLRELRDIFDTVVTSDPMCIYKPKHAVAEAFHRSKAKIRYFFGGKRISKTESGKAEIYWTVTGQHPWRPRPPQPAQCAIVGLSYSKYAPRVFEPKYIVGEPGNILSPMFPENGKWLHHYDPRSRIIHIACPECAAAGRAKLCPHPKSSITLFSDEGKPTDMEGAQFSGIQYDEQIAWEFFTVGLDRVKTVPHSWIVVTETPDRGRGFWTQKELVPLAESKKRIPGTDIPLCETFHIDQFQAGIAPHGEIWASMEMQPESYIRTRIFGEPMVHLDKAIFDPDVLSHMRATDMKIGRCGILSIEVVKRNDDGTPTDDPPILSCDYTEKSQRTLLSEAGPDTTCAFSLMEGGELEIFENPQPYTQYIIGADVAHGLTSRDASCADVLKMAPIEDTLCLEQVCQYHAWINPMQYAEELFKIGLLYKTGTEYFPYLVIERNGPGLEVIQCLIDMGCWFVFQDATSVAQVKTQMQSQYGVTTTFASKPVLISVLQSLIRARKQGKKHILIRSERSFAQLENYIQEETDKGNVRFQADQGFRDDCVMSLAVGSYGAKNFPLFDWGLHWEWQERIKAEEARAKKDSHSKKFWDDLREEKEELEQRRYELALEYGIDPEEVL